MKKMTGHEYKEFINSDWDKLLGVTGAYMDAQEITVDGKDEWDVEESIPDDAKVVISDGYVLADQELNLSLETLFTRWKKAQTVTTFVVEIPNAYVDYFKKHVSTCKGRVVK